MAKTPTPRFPPLSLRLSFAERAALEQMARGQSLSSYIKGELFGGPTGPGMGLGLTTPQRSVRRDEMLLAQLLGKLGDSQLGPSMGRLAQAAATGSLYVDDLLAQRLHQACDDIAAMRLLLLEALGKRRAAPAPKPKTLTEAFRLAATGSINRPAPEVSP